MMAEPTSPLSITCVPKVVSLLAILSPLSELEHPTANTPELSIAN